MMNYLFKMKYKSILYIEHFVDYYDIHIADIHSLIQMINFSCMFIGNFKSDYYYYEGGKLFIMFSEDSILIDNNTFEQYKKNIKFLNMII